MKAALEDYNLRFLYKTHTHKIRFNIPEPPSAVCQKHTLL